MEDGGASVRKMGRCGEGGGRWRRGGLREGAGSDGNEEDERWKMEERGERAGQVLASGRSDKTDGVGLDCFIFV